MNNNRNIKIMKKVGNGF